jgi:phage terminase small subunit
MPLTKKRRLILAAFAGDPTISLKVALVRAGYSKTRAAVTACELAKDPEFVQLLEKRQNQTVEKISRGPLTQQAVLDTLRDIDGECAAIGPTQWAMALRVKIQELLGKHTGAFVERVEIGFGAELAKEIQAARQRVTVIEGTFTEMKALPENAN